MTNPSQLEAVFFAALEIRSPAERQAYLDDACASDDALRHGVERMLAAQAEAGSFFESPALATSSPPRYSGEGLGEGPTNNQHISAGPGTVIGPYKLLQQIGEGGMGVVFMAEQTAPIQRTVALKIIKPGMDTRQVIARFEAERQALALMDHPNIARVLDAGTTANPMSGSKLEAQARVGEGKSGRGGESEFQASHRVSPSPRLLVSLSTSAARPYFVMELVKGVPITRYCDQNRLSVRQRLTLFTEVCHAVQHAHQKGIIHRDLKPSNVLVQGTGSFFADASSPPDATKEGPPTKRPAKKVPAPLPDEQPLVKVIDFGVAKATAQKLTEKTMFTEFGQLIGTFEYMSPEQAKFNQLDIDTRSDIYSLGVLLYELLTGTTPLERQRLETVAFDETLRIIREEDPPKPSTRLSRSGEPSRTPSGSLPLAGRAGEGGDSATIAANRRTKPARLTKEICGDLDWIVMKALEKDRNRRYESASALAADVQRHLNDEPVLALAPSRTYRALKFVRRNRAALIASAALFAGLLACVIGMAVGVVSQSRQREAAKREEAEAQLNLGLSLQSQAKYTEAESLFRQALITNIGATLQDRQRAARTRLRLAQMAHDQGDKAESERLHREALAAYRAEFPPGDPNIAQALGELANILQAQQRFAEAEPLIREAHAIHRAAVPIDHFMIATSGTLLGNVLVTLGRFAEAEPILRNAIVEHQQVDQPNKWALGLTRTVLGRDLIMMGDFLEAEVQLLEAEQVLASTEAARHGSLALAALYTTWDQAKPGNGCDAKAREWFRKSIEEYLRPLPKVGERKDGQ